jgi:signal transduction histidine kinase
VSESNLLPDNAALAQRVEDIARVAGRLAHDFDNILTGVIGFTELTQSVVPAGVARQHLAELHRVGQQGVELTKRLHQLSRAAGVTPGPVPIVGLLADLERRFQKKLPANVTQEFRLAADLPRVRVDSEAIRQALDELLTNAVEACSAGGAITVTAESTTLSATDCLRLLGEAEAGDYVCVTIADSGAGISAQARARVLVEACFTTKPRHRGLGLPIVYRILHAHGAGLSLDSASGGGTAVRVYLPVTR